MNSRSMLGAAVATVIAAGGLAGIAAAVPDDADDNVTGQEADRAREAAVDAAGGGRAQSVERESEGSVVWEVEVIMPDGSVLEYDLDQSYGVVSSEQDDDDDGTDDDAGETDDD